MYNNFNIDGNNWIKALYKAIESGWSVTFLIRLDDNIRRITDFIHYLKPIFRTGRVNINYIKNYDCTLLGSEKIVIPGIGAMTIYSIGNNTDSYYSFYFKNVDAVEIIKLSITSILTSASEKLTNYYGSDKRRYFSFHLMQNHWRRYQKDFEYANDISFEATCISVRMLMQQIYESN